MPQYWLSASVATGGRLLHGPKLAPQQAARSQVGWSLAGLDAAEDEDDLPFIKPE
jgi:hypothetical protein